MHLEDGALEVLHRVGLAVEIAGLDEGLGDGIAVLREATVLLPVGEELIADGVPGLRERLAAGIGLGERAGSLPARGQQQTERDTGAHQRHGR